MVFQREIKSIVEITYARYPDLTQKRITDNVKSSNFKLSTANGYYKAIAAMAEKGIIGGYADGRYGPNDPIKRGQIASILPSDGDISNPFKDVSGYGSYDGNILIIYKLGITKGTTPSTFSPNAANMEGHITIEELEK